MNPEFIICPLCKKECKYNAPDLNIAGYYSCPTQIYIRGQLGKPHYERSFYDYSVSYHEYLICSTYRVVNFHSFENPSEDYSLITKLEDVSVNLRHLKSGQKRSHVDRTAFVSVGKLNTLLEFTSEEHMATRIKSLLVFL